VSGNAISNPVRNWLDTSPHAAAAPDRCRVDGERRVAGLAEEIDARSEVLQRRHEIADGALVHAGYPGEPEFPVHHRQHRGERPERRAGVAEIELRALHWKRAGRPLHPHRTPALVLPVDAQLAQRAQHDLGVVGFEHVAHPRLAARERGEQQHAVGDALRPRERNAPADAPDRLQLEMVHGLGTLLHEPLFARGARARKHALELVRIAARDRGPHRLELVFVIFQHGK
jgi:hypothetical protein